MTGWSNESVDKVLGLGPKVPVSISDLRFGFHSHRFRMATLYGD